MQWTPLFSGWWTYDTAPSDPWALWQYLAYSLELNGRPIPDLFRPLTDTSGVHAAIHARIVHQELAAWRHALAPPSPAFRYVDRTTPLTGLTGLRGRLNEAGRLMIEVRAAADKPWKPPAQKWFRELAATFPADFEHLTAAEVALGLALAAECRNNPHGFSHKQPVPPETSGRLIAAAPVCAALVMQDES